jgi:hypothetical protein
MVKLEGTYFIFILYTGNNMALSMYIYAVYSVIEEPNVNIYSRVLIRRRPVNTFIINTQIWGKISAKL